jgi:hypothetical protein
MRREKVCTRDEKENDVECNSTGNGITARHGEKGEVFAMIERSMKRRVLSS